MYSSTNSHLETPITKHPSETPCPFLNPTCSNRYTASTCLPIHPIQSDTPPQNLSSNSLWNPPSNPLPQKNKSHPHPPPHPVNTATKNGLPPSWLNSTHYPSHLPSAVVNSRPPSPTSLHMIPTIHPIHQIPPLTVVFRWGPRPPLTDGRTIIYWVRMDHWGWHRWRED